MVASSCAWSPCRDQSPLLRRDSAQRFSSRFVGRVGMGFSQWEAIKLGLDRRCSFVERLDLLDHLGDLFGHRLHDRAEPDEGTRHDQAGEDRYGWLLLRHQRASVG